MIPIIKLQHFQEQHDRQYHFDVYSMPLQRRLDHLFKHIVKYSSSDLKRNESYPDALACILSMANALNLNLGHSIEQTHQSIVVHLNDICPQYFNSILPCKLQMTIASIAKILEGHDHTESIDYRKELSSHVTDLLVIFMQFRTVIDEQCEKLWITEYASRLFEIKKKSIFFVYNHSESMDRDSQYRTIWFLTKASNS